MFNIKKFLNGLKIIPKTTSTASAKGEFEVIDSTGKAQFHNGTSVSPIVTESHSAPLTNKTLVVANNVITTAASGGLVATELNAALAELDGDISSGGAALTAHINNPTDAHDASAVSVSAISGLTAVNVQAALAEHQVEIENTYNDLGAHIVDTIDAHDASAISSIPSGNLSATDIQGAVNELQTDVDTRATSAALTAHITNTTGAHAGTAISNAPSGNLAAITVQAALNELQTDVDTRATASALSAHESSTAAHGATGAVVGTTNTQTLTNKTLTAPVINAPTGIVKGDVGLGNVDNTSDATKNAAAATLTNKIIIGADFRTPIRSDVKQDTFANLTTYATTATNGQLVFATDTKLMYQVVDTLLVSVGSSSGGVANVNALLTQTFNSAVLADFTQTGLALSTTNPINGTTSARLIHQPATPQSFKQTITVDRKYRGELMTLSLQNRSTASEGNLTLLVTDETNAITIMASSAIQTGQYQVATATTTNTSTTVGGFSNVDINTLNVGASITGTGIPTGTAISSINTALNTIVISQAATATGTITAKFSALPQRRTFSFTIPSNCASLSYTVTALQEADLPSSTIDDVVIELANVSLLETSVTVPVMTAWASYTPTFTGFGTAASIEFQWRQVGGSVEIEGKFTAGTTTAVEARISLPNGYTSSNTSTIKQVGKAISSVQSASFFGFDTLLEASVQYLTFGNQTSTANGLTKINGTSFVGVTTLFASVPISGLSATTDVTIPLTQSGVIQEADSAIRLDTANGYGSTGTKIRRFTNIRENIGSDIQYIDSATAGSSFTALTSGTYSINYSDGFTSAQQLGISKNASSLTTDIQSLSSVEVLARGTTQGASVDDAVSWTGYLTVGDIIRPHSQGAAAGGLALFTMSKQGSLSQVSINTNSKITIPTSELRFEGASSRGSVATAIVKFDTMAKIRGDAFTVTSTTADGTFVTMTKKGKLDVSASTRSTGGTTYITKNQAILTALTTTPSEILAAEAAESGTGGLNLSWSGIVEIGDVLRLSQNTTPISGAGNSLNLSFQEQDIQVSVSNTLPQFSESDSSVRLDTANGYGSTGTSTRRFSNVRDNIGVDVEYTDSATAGASFVAKTSGIYEISYSDQFNAADNLGISKNSSSLTSNINAIAVTERLVIGRTTAANVADCVSWQGYLVAGDIIRAQTGASPSGTTPALSSFTMSKVGKPNVTGVDVTPFVNIPQPITAEARFEGASARGAVATFIVKFDSKTKSNGDAFTVTNTANDGTYFTMNRAGKLSTTANFRVAAGTHGGISKNQVTLTTLPLAAESLTSTGPDSGASYISSSWSGDVVVGDIIRVYSNVTPTSDAGNTLTLSFTGNADQILTAPETFSTDTAPLAYAGSGTYTLATLSNAPVGTFITFTYAINTNTRTQTTTAPTQTTGDMNTNGIQIFTRAFNAASTSASPTSLVLQIGKGLKGVSFGVFKSTGKVTTGEMDKVVFSTTTERGFNLKSYNESTGVLFLEAGGDVNATTTSNGISFIDQTSQTSGYLVINASKNPALTGLGLPRVATRGVSTSGQSIGNAITTVTYDAVKTFDTIGGLNSATGTYTAQDSGYYSVTGQVAFSSRAYAANQNILTYLYKNGVEYTRNQLKIQQGVTMVTYIPVSDLVYLIKGETIDMRALNEAGATALRSSGSENYLSITKANV